MNKEFKLPDVGEGLTEANIVSWHVKPGDTIEDGQVIVEIETAKAVVELPSPYAGTVTGLLVEEGQTVDVGTPIIAVDVGGTDGAAGKPTAEPATAEPATAEAAAAQAAVQAATEPGATEPEGTAAGSRRAGCPDGRSAGSAGGPRRLRRQAGIDEPPGAQEAADAARVVSPVAGDAPGGFGGTGSPPERGVPGGSAPGGKQSKAAGAAARQGPGRRPVRADRERA